MSIHAFPSPTTARRRSAQQQQPARFWLNRQQQQQGYSEYQHGQVAPATAVEPGASVTPTIPFSHRPFRSTP